MVNSPLRVDTTLPPGDQLALAERIHQAELALADDLAQADLQYKIERGEAKRRRGHAIAEAESKHRAAISHAQLVQLDLAQRQLAAGEDD